VVVFSIPYLLNHAIGYTIPLQSRPDPKATNGSYLVKSCWRVQRQRQDRFNRSKCNLASTSATSSRPIRKSITLYAPLWTILAAVGGMTQPTFIASTIGTLPTMQAALASLMLAMGLTITPTELKRATQQPRVLALNAFCCFVLMPVLALVLAKSLSFSPSQLAGTVLLGSVSGGQASNLFALLAGGDVALSVVCTLSTTLLGVVATPLLVKGILGCSVAVDGFAMLRSVASLVLMPLVLGLVLGRLVEKQVPSLRKNCPTAGVFASLILVAGGAASSVSSITTAACWQSTVAASILLPILGGLLALLLVSKMDMPEPSKRTFVIEVLSKSPTLALVLARKHFDASAAAIPACSMVSLALVGALVASWWSAIKINC
jgi:BASS family bile acid:Na+ symporter